MSDGDALTRFLAKRSEAAFADLVAEHGRLVHSAAAWQFPQDPATADEVAQSTFLVLYQRADRIRDPATIRSWLVGIVRRVAKDRRQADAARRFHERKAAMSHPAASVTSDAGETLWAEAREHLTEALAAMPTALSSALIAQYLDARDRRDAASSLGVSENTLKMRVQRGLAWLRGWYARKGMTIETTALSGFLVALPMSDLPATWAATTAHAVSSGTLPAATTASAAAVGKSLAVTGLVKVAGIAIGCAAAAGLAVGVAIWSGPPRPAAPVLGDPLAVAPPADPPARPGLVPLGHKDFYPSDARPVGYRGDGSGWFPGATIVSEWQEGAPVEKEATVPDLVSLKPVKGKYIDLDEAKPKNIVWKTLLPTYGNTPPLVVGDKVFTQGEFWHLYCVDANTGKLLWSHACSPWDAAGLDRKLVEKLEKLYELQQSVLSGVSRFLFGGTTSRGLGADEALPLFLDYEKDVPVLLAGLKELDPENLKVYEEASQKTLKALEPFRTPEKIPLSGGHNGRPILQVGKLGGEYEWPAAVQALSTAIQARIANLSPVAVNLTVPWGNMVGFTLSGLVSDGKRIYGRTFQGQSWCVDLDGKRIWATFDHDCTGNPGNGQCANPPVLVDEILYLGYPRHYSSKKKFSRIGKGYDKLTGKKKWEVMMTTTSEYEVNPAVPLRLQLGGKELAVLVLQDNQIVRAADGIVVGKVPLTGDTGSSAVAMGDLFLRGGGKTEAKNITAFRLTAKDDKTVEVAKVYETTNDPKLTGLIATDQLLIARDVVELSSGKTIAQGARGSGTAAGTNDILVGSLRIWGGGEEGGMVAWNPLIGNGWGGRRFDGKNLVGFTVVDYRDPAKPKPVTNRNYLGSAAQPPVPWYEKWTPALFANANYFDKSKGKPAHLLTQDTGVYPQGNRLFIRTVGHLYCIGDPKVPYDWNPASRPK